MPELPEVETTRRGIAPHLIGYTIDHVTIREPRLRWPISPTLVSDLPGQVVCAVKRRGKYLLLETQGGCLILHLGMSGSLRILAEDTPFQKHDHVDIVLSNATCLRLRDPRRFGTLLWTRDPPSGHPLLARLGPEPWDQPFNGDYLYRRARGRAQAVKSFIMDSHTVVGVGNIYANEALFEAGINPARKSGRISLPRYARLAAAIGEVLEAAIRSGGTTLRDFVGSSGRPGYFRNRLKIYDRSGLPCPRCSATIRQRWIGQRGTYYCPKCQR